MEVVIKVMSGDHDAFAEGKEYKALKVEGGYFAKTSEVSKFIPAHDAVECEVTYSE